MTFEVEHNIDMILVNPSEEERIRSTFTMNGMIKEASLITPFIFVPKGQMMACDREKAMQIGIKFGGEGTCMELVPSERTQRELLNEEEEHGSGNVQRDTQGQESV